MVTVPPISTLVGTAVARPAGDVVGAAVAVMETDSIGEMSSDVAASGSCSVELGALVGGVFSVAPGGQIVMLSPFLVAPASAIAATPSTTSTAAATANQRRTRTVRIFAPERERGALRRLVDSLPGCLWWG